MRVIAYVCLPAALLFAFACGAAPETEMAATAAEPERASPHESVSAKLGEATITITYGRPYKKGREIYGGLVPFDEVWRTGADEATTLETDRDLMLDALHVPAGKYGLFTVPGSESWTLIINKVADQWGAFSYAEDQDLGRVQMTVGESEPTEQLTIGIEAGEGPNGTLSIVWDTTAATLPIMAH